MSSTSPASASSNQQITCDSTVVALSAAGSSSGPEFTYLWSGQNIVSGQTNNGPEGIGYWDIYADCDG